MRTLRITSYLVLFRSLCMVCINYYILQRLASSFICIIIFWTFWNHSFFYKQNQGFKIWRKIYCLRYTKETHSNSSIQHHSRAFLAPRGTLSIVIIPIIGILRVLVLLISLIGSSGRAESILATGSQIFIILIRAGLVIAITIVTSRVLVRLSSVRGLHWRLTRVDWGIIRPGSLLG